MSLYKIQTTMSSINSLYVTCKNNDISRVRELLQTLPDDELSEQGPNKRKALDVIASYGYADISELLLAHKNINQSIKTQWSCIANDEAPAYLKFLFDKMSTIGQNDTINEYDDYAEELIE
ncbi:unnamed protein product [Rotaria sp. Silwood2]|nr:unnamed protein product [Rotaria sp. Silwood2]